MAVERKSQADVVITNCLQNELFTKHKTLLPVSCKLFVRLVCELFIKSYAPSRKMVIEFVNILTLKYENPNLSENIKREILFCLL